MSKFFKLALVLAIFVVSIPTFSKDNIPVEIQKQLKASLSLGSTAQGYEFFIAIPPNEISTYMSQASLFIYVSSTKPTEVSLEVGATGALISKKKITNAMGVITFSNLTGEINNKGNEVRIPETPLDMGLRIVSSSNPISVYCMNSKSTSSDGFMAIPTSAWGTDYIHVAYYDKHEGTDNAMGLQYYGAGFIIVAAENDTKVRIEIEGVGGSFGSTTTGRKPGDPAYDITLNKGQVYLVQGDGKSLGSFDLTGSRIKSDKPIGLLSYHQRTDVPALIGSSRDHLVEMIPPVQSWGKKYATMEFERNNLGDLFRIVSSEPMTTYNVQWYDMKTDKLLGSRSGTLTQSSQFVDISEIMQAPGVGYSSIRGVAHFEANKPIFVMHYSYSSGWDNNYNFDPFMVCVTPVEQYTKSTIFQTPNKVLKSNYFNLIAVGDTLDWANHVKLIESIEIDGKPVHTLAAQFKQARIPNTNLYWARISLSPGAHYIVGDTPFGGSVNGSTSFDSYGWPGGMAVNNLDQTDTLSPQIYVEGKCGEYAIRYTELRNGLPNDNPKQVDLGVAQQPSLLDGSFNFDEPDFGSGFVTYPTNYDDNFKLHVSDLNEDAYAIIAIIDRAGNVAIEEIFYNVAKITIDPEISNFGNIRINTDKVLPVKLSNVGLSSSEILSIDFQSGSVFSIANKPKLPLSIKEGENLPLDIKYSPKNESPSAAAMDLDSIIITTDCKRFAFPVDGRGVSPKIMVDDWNAGSLSLGEQVCLNGGLIIKNPGTMPLRITGFDWAKSDPAFTISDPTKPPFPFTIQAGGTLNLNTVCFKPIVDKLYYEAIIVFKSDKESGRDTAILIGKSGPEISSYDWEKRRVIDDSSPGYSGTVYIKNNGSSKIILEQIDLMLNATTKYIGNDFVISSTEPSLAAGPVEIYPKMDTDPTHTTTVAVNLTFNPKSENNIKKVEVHPIFSAANAIPAGFVVGSINGIGYLPAIEAMGYEFLKAQTMGILHPDKDGKIEIKSLSTTADLYIQKINIVDLTTNASQDFKFGKALPKDTILPMGKSLTIPVTFTPSRIGKREIRLDIINDAFKAADSINITPITLVGYGSDGIDVPNVSEKFNMLPIYPNPAVSGEANLEFSIGLDNVYTKIELINSIGKIVRTLQDGIMNTGSYRARILTNDLSSGIYIVRMVSGQFNQREKLVISK